VGNKSSSLNVGVPNLGQESKSSSIGSVFLPSLAAGHSGQAPDGPLAAPCTVQEYLMFLKPMQMAKGECVLRIVGYIDKLLPNPYE